MKRTLFFGILAVVLGFTACSDDDDNKETITGGGLPTQTTGTAMRMGDIPVNWIQLWAGGPKFAEYNIGAENNKAEDYGFYLTWGGKINNVDAATWTDDHRKGLGDLTGTDDTAIYLWGSNWRMPTKDELEGLFDPAKCTATWVEDYNGSNKGLLFQGLEGTAYKDNSVFFPAAGSIVDGDFLSKGSCCYYWTSAQDVRTGAFCLYHNSRSEGVTDCIRGRGNSIRPVLAE